MVENDIQYETGTGKSVLAVKVAVVVALVVAVGGVSYLKGQQKTTSSREPATAVLPQGAKGNLDADKGARRPSGGLPRLVDLGADKCIACKMMAPILEKLKQEYAVWRLGSGLVSSYSFILSF